MEVWGRLSNDVGIQLGQCLLDTSCSPSSKVFNKPGDGKKVVTGCEVELGMRPTLQQGMKRGMTRKEESSSPSCYLFHLLFF